MERWAPADVPAPRGRLGAPGELAGNPAVRRAAEQAGLELVADDAPCDVRLIGPAELREFGARALRRQRMRGADAIALVIHAGDATAELVRECFREGAMDVLGAAGLAEELPRALTGLLRRQNAGRSEDDQMRRLAQALGRRARELETALEEVRTSYEETLHALVAALDCREKETAFHSQRVAGYAVRLGVCAGLNNSALESLYRGALLHDIGKIGIPDAILLKPGKLTPDEWQVMKTHAQIGSELLGRIHFLRDASEVPRCHHEAWDGSGYPHGTAGDAIPLGARIFAITDTYDAIRSKRPYKEALPHERALAELRSAAGRRLDPQLVERFCSEPEERWTAIAQGAHELIRFEEMLMLCGARLQP